MSGDGVVLELAGVSGGYGRRDVVHDVDLRVRAGERLAIVGPNGAGKSTLLRLVTGLLAPTTGEIRVGGARLASLSRTRRLAPSIFLVPASHICVGSGPNWSRNPVNIAGRSSTARWLKPIAITSGSRFA